MTRLTPTVFSLTSLTSLISVFLLVGCQHSATQFALIGDSPYVEENLPKYQRMIERINETPDIDWVVHLGDMKSGSSNCRDEDLLRLYLLNKQFDAPLVLTPGDNDWFDCKREVAGGWGRLDRLDKLREIFYREPPALPLVSQGGRGRFGDFIENVYWQDAGVVFAAVHLTGISGTEGGLDLHNDIQDAAIEWLDEVFEVAGQSGAAGVFLATQADIYPFSGEPSWMATVCPVCLGVRLHYEKFHEALLKHTREFENPILLAVGDTHIFRVDKPLYDGGELVEHFTRVEGFGEDTIHWVRIVVRPETSQVFEIHQEIIPENTSKAGK
ncbi:MAG: metallophosphoesterase [Candidatus Azotimanducaceae bacterium WSBS_2022_MAG_OTU7]